MLYRKDFHKLLADEEFQSGIIHFDSFDRDKKKTFIKRHSINKEEFVKARTVINGLNFKEIDFTEAELNYLWEKLGIETNIIPLRSKIRNKKIINWVNRVAAILFIPLLITSPSMLTSPLILCCVSEDAMRVPISPPMEWPTTQKESRPIESTSRQRRRI